MTRTRGGRWQGLLTAVLMVCSPSTATADPTPPPAPPETEATAPPEIEAPPPDQTSPPPETSVPPPLSRVTLKDGQQLRGYVTSRDEQSLVLELTGGGQLTISLDALSSVVEETRPMVERGGALLTADPNRTRYLYGPSAMMLRKGELSFSQKELAFSTLAYGVTDHVSVQVGSVLPAIFAGVQGLNLIGAVKFGGQLTENIHLATGVQAIGLFPNNALAGGVLAFATGTYGNADTHVSLSAGLGSLGQINGGPVLTQPLFSISANHRLSSKFALLSENWFVPISSASVGQRGGFILVDGVALRFLGEHLAVDAGAVLFFSQEGLLIPIPVPWLDFTYNF